MKAKSLSACLAGKWRAGGAIGDPETPGPAWMLDAEFRSDGTFHMDGYPPIQIDGKWKIFGNSPGKLHIRLTQRIMRMNRLDKGSVWPDLDEWATFSENSRQIILDGKIFSRD